tara:strand:+ start:21 stop:206 length:186 start_codon:yes stop_codon:yes gene_type:complete
MISSIYNYCHPDEYEMGVFQVKFYEQRIECIKRKALLGTEDKDKIKKLELTINCIKYYYNI